MLSHPVFEDGWWRGGLTVDERRAGLLPPVWATDAEQALAQVEDLPTLAATFPSWRQGYAEVLRPFVEWAVSQVPTHPCVPAFAERLYADLTDLAARTLTFELNECRVAATLTGAGGHERFRGFIRRARRPSDVAALLTRYPVLARLLLVACRSSAVAYAETLRRFTADRGAIARAFFEGTDPGDPVALDPRRGDPHRGGRSVSILEFAGGRRVVYKPRSLAACAAFSRLTQWLDDKASGPGQRTARLLDRERYGWQEYIPASSCADTAGVRRFYQRQGALLALLYAVGACDIHYANVVAAGEHPVLIDLETLFHPDVLREGLAQDPAASLLVSSVHRTGVLPTFLLGDHSALDTSALGGDPGNPYPVDAVEWEAPATDRMRLVRRPRPFAGGANRPTVNGEPPEPADHAEDLLRGFRAGYDAIANDRESFIEAVTRLEFVETRVVLRPTQVYSTLLAESTHPSLLRDAAARNEFFEVLRTSSTDQPLLTRAVPYEIADLWHGDVPIFLGHPDSAVLRTSDGTVLRRAFDTAGRVRAARTVRAMGAGDRRTQEWIVRATLATRRPVSDRPRKEACPPDPLAAAKAIGDQICDVAVVGGSRANWLGVEQSDDRLSVMPMGATLAYGYTGVALFLAQLAELTGVDRFARTARLAIGGIPHVLDAVAGRPDLIRAVGCGAYDGFGGIAYALARITTLVGDDRARQWTHVTVDLAAEAAGEDAPPGIADGLAGCLAAMMAVDAELGIAPAGALATRCARSLTGLVDDERTGTGFAHGTAGIRWALSRYTAAAHAHTYEPAGSQLLGNGPRSDSGVRTPGLNDLAGVGFRLLRLAAPQDVPSVFHLEPGITAAHHERRARDISVPHTPLERS